jgi:hypothetical protein
MSKHLKDEGLTLFVAMPGTEMGERASWNSPDDIKEDFLEPVRDALSRSLKRHVELIIEKDKDRSGPIHRSMFDEAWKANVYIADLTGANANVYLELGVRWALRKQITILVCQDLDEVRFNAAATRP